MNRIDALFERKRREGRASLIIFLSAGYPDMPSSVELACAALDAGADLIEFGIPFSDPVADGPSIQRSSAIALRRGATLNKCLEAVGQIRARHADAPIVLFGALNPFLRHGLREIARDGRLAGADGFIIPDLPPEESAEFEESCRAEEMKMTHLLAPTSPPDRQRLIAERSGGFIYIISLKGVTGARKDLSQDLVDRVRELRKITAKPLAIGFGISTPEHARQAACIADGVVVGSAFIDLAAQHEGKPDMLDRIREYVASLASAMNTAVHESSFHPQA